MAGGVASRIVELLSERNMTQKELSRMTQITESAISHYVKGDRIPRGVNLIKLAKALETTTDDLLRGGQILDEGKEFEIIQTLIARKAEVMTQEEKMRLIKILSGGN